MSNKKTASLKRGTSTKTLTLAVASACLVIGAGAAHAVDCPATISGGQDGCEVKGSLTVNNGVTVSGANDGLGYDGVAIRVLTNATNITNNGTISGTDGGLLVDGNITVNAITNTGTGVINGGIDVPIARITTLTNDGSIDGGNDTAGIGVSEGGTISSIVNTGSIGGEEGIGVADTGSTVTSINNSGTISGTFYGIIAEDGGKITTITNTATGIIASPTVAIDLTGGSGATTINNAGTINGEVRMNNSTTLNMLNGGKVNGVVSGGGTLAVAAGATATVTSYTQSANSVLRIGADSETSYGKLNVTGTADLSASGKINVNAANYAGITDGKTLTSVLTAGSLTAGALITTDNSLLWRFEAVQNGNDIDLIAHQDASLDAITTTGGGSSTAQSVAQTLDQIAASNPSPVMQDLLDALGTVATTTPEAVASAVESLAPINSGSLAQVATGNLQGVNNVVQARLETA
ncbi:MAG: hypothetical protein LBE62_10535, partial [Azonexus sp.]|nr:hypothetical protein [Azonexus sp.]